MDIAVSSPRMLSVLRIMTGLLFMEHGTQKLLGFPHPRNPGPALLSLLGLQGVLELVGGALILIGFLTTSGRLYSGGRHGSRLFHGARTERLLARHQWRPAGDPLLLCVPLSLYRRRRCLEP